MQRSLFVELLRQQLVTALIPIILIGGVAALVIFPRLEDDLVSHHRSIARSVGEQVSTYLDGSKELLKLVAMDVINNPNASLLSYRLDGFVQVSNIFETVYVTGPDDKIDHIGLSEDKVATRRLFLGMDVSFSTLWDRELLPEYFAWSNIFISPISGNQSVALQTKIGRSTLVAEVDILSMPALADSLSRDNLVVMILDEKATLIGHPDPEISQQQLNLGYSGLFTENIDTTRSGLYEWEGETYHATVVPLAETGWQVVVSESTKTFMSSIDYLIIVWGTLAFLTLLISSYFAYQTARHQSLPFTHLKNMTQKISGGNYEIRGLKTAIEEIAAVSEAFELMANRIKTRESELTDLNKELEERVEERTAELLTINDELTNSVSHLENTMEQLVQSEKLASLGSLVAGIAHELNTPIGNAKIAASSQQDYLRDIHKVMEKGGLTKTMLAQFMEDIGSTADMGFRNMERASELIRSFKQIAVDQTSSKQREFNLATLLNEVLVTLRPTLKRNPVHVVTQIPTSIVMKSIPGPLSQVLTNLINNAVFHGLEDKESITIHIEAEEVNGTVHLIVQDTGVGIPTEYVKRAFDPFFTTKLGQGGSGLGLNIVHRIVTGVLHGNIELTSNTGAGTTIRIALPADISHIKPILDSAADTVN